MEYPEKTTFDEAELNEQSMRAYSEEDIVIVAPKVTKQPVRRMSSSKRAEYPEIRSARPKSRYA
jgi:hypothetical protein